eukprot:211776-Pleurochrysis_carterae.AAC.1
MLSRTRVERSTLVPVLAHALINGRSRTRTCTSTCLRASARARSHKAHKHTRARAQLSWSQVPTVSNGGRLEEQMPRSRASQYGERMQRMQSNNVDLAAFEELFSFASPKQISSHLTALVTLTNGVPKRLVKNAPRNFCAWRDEYLAVQTIANTDALSAEQGGQILAATSSHLNFSSLMLPFLQSCYPR